MHRKRAIFWGVTLAIPPLILLAFELTLRLSGYGEELKLVTVKEVAGRQYYSLNRGFARRYFSQKGIAVPEPHDDLFEVIKQHKTKRVFCLGESTMAGFPFDYNATPPRLLADRLRRLLPDYNIEVVNAGLSAVNSYTVRDMISELIEYEPDAFVVYLAHNEFYGALGIGSTEYLGQIRWLVNLSLKMQRLRVFLLIRDVMSSMKNLVTKLPTVTDATLMETMVRDRAIPYNSREYELGREIFQNNLRDILEMTRRRDIPVVLSTVVSNLKDQPPLKAVFDSELPRQVQEKWNLLFEEGNRFLHQKDYKNALEKYEAARKIDSSRADLFYKMGQCLETRTQFTEAAHLYLKAKDYDALRFRATSDFNELIKKLANEKNATIAHVEAEFAQRSPNQIVGSNLVLEHLHPNLEGYLLMAKVFTEALSQTSFIENSEAWRWNLELNEDEYKRLAGVTDFDLELAGIRIYYLTNHWPFTRANEEARPYKPQDKIQELALRYAQKRIPWSRARYDLAEWYTQGGEFQKAFNEYYAVSKILFYHYYPFMKMGDMALLMNRDGDAESYYHQSVTLEKNPFTLVRLGMLYLEKKQLPRAIQYLEETLQKSRNNGKRWQNAAEANARYYLGAAYAESGDIPKARENLEGALLLQPDLHEAKELLTQLTQTKVK